jgi:putative glycerol kinase 5
VPAFGFLEVENGDKTSVGTGFIGIKSNTTKAEMVRAIFDSIAFSIKLRMDLLMNDLRYHGIPLTSIKYNLAQLRPIFIIDQRLIYIYNIYRISGGVCKSEAFCQYLSNLLERPIEKSNFSYTSSAYGAAFLAGLSSNLFKNLKDLSKYRKIENIYRPEVEKINENNHYFDDLTRWKNALQRFLNWYKID